MFNTSGWLLHSIFTRSFDGDTYDVFTQLGDFTSKDVAQDLNQLLEEEISVSNLRESW